MTSPTQPDARQVVEHKAIIDKLLNAAFKELQHDTGPQDREYVFQRRILAAEFEKILSRDALQTANRELAAEVERMNAYIKHLRIVSP